MKTNLSKFAHANWFPNLPVIKGIQLSSVDAGISKQNKLDLTLIEASPNSIISGLFTKSKTCSYAVDWGRKNLKIPQNLKQPIAIVVNSGNANVFTGLNGEATVQKTISSVTHHLQTAVENVFVASTGVIGEYLPFEKITSQMEVLVKNLKPNSFLQAANAIMTTDTFPKGIHRQIKLGETKVKINGIAKGSGMIAPNMATMLVFIFTDISIEKNVLQEIVMRCNNQSFNCITVDSDTSTSDSLFLIATGKAKMSKIKSLEDPRAIKFQKYLTKAMLKLAQLVVKDGEGITKFVEIICKGAKNHKTAVKVAKSIANSPLVKTAIAGEDANWGRIVMAIGKSGAKIDKEKLSIVFGKYIVATNGTVAENYDELTVSKYMKNDSLSITVDLGLGDARASIYTCDLTHDYISINADYRS